MFSPIYKDCYLQSFILYLLYTKTIKMKLATWAFALIFFTSCSAVKVLQVQSDLKSSNDGYVFENDSVKITYHFWQENGRMQYDVYNKLSVPLYIDWKTSAFIPNDKMVSYWRDETNTESVSSGYYYKGVGIGSSKIKAVHMERIAVIPPESMITQSSFILLKWYTDIADKGTFDKAQSPLRFRNYMMIAGTEKFDGKVTAINNSFFVSSIKKTNSNKFVNYKSQTAFFVQKKLQQ